jgi:hypothetical protein
VSNDNVSTYVNANGYSNDPTASFSLDWNSPYLRDIPLPDDSAKEELALRCKAACGFIERYCNRKFAQQGYTGVFTVKQEGSIILDNPPITSVDGVFYCNAGWLNLYNPSAYTPTASTMDGQIKLSQVVSGVRSSQVFTYAAYPTIGSMATAINAYGHGWQANVTPGNDAYGFPLSGLPTFDIVSFQMNTCNTWTPLLSWIPYNAMLAPNIWPTRDFFLQYDVSSGVLSWFFPRGLRLRVDYVGGFDPIPEPIKLVAANMVTQSNRKQSETLGDYQFSLADIEALPDSDKRLLGYYKDRRC